MVKKTDLKTTITDIGNKIPNIASLVTTAVSYRRYRDTSTSLPNNSSFF